MSARDLVTFTNLLFIVAGIYFVIVSALGEASTYSLVGTVLCLVAVTLSIRKGIYFVAPWRVATSSFVLSMSFSSYLIAASTLINGIFLILFLGVLLLTAKEMTKQKKEEEKPKQEKKSTQKVTYEI
ncbi:MAG: hypothetical protein M1368_10270 [Thaumarchaeota archaeon]|nr:hypothetical protein [Nitrososphaerota archaeon]